MLRKLPLTALLLSVLLLPLAASAQVITFGHWDALAGGITPADAPGYPVTLTDVGSFRLDSNLYADPGVPAIELQYDQITIDLAGFTIAAHSGSNPSTYGILGSKQKWITVTNGTIRGFSKEGIYLQDEARLQNLRLLSNGGNGIDVRNGALIQNVQTVTNRKNGVLCRDSCVISDVVAMENDISGIVCNDLCNVRDSVGRNHFENAGIIVGDGSIARNNISAFNKVGIFVNGQGLAESNVVTHNTDHQIVVGDDSGTSTNVVDDVQILGDHELDPSACIGGLCL